MHVNTIQINDCPSKVHLFVDILQTTRALVSHLVFICRVKFCMSTRTRMLLYLVMAVAIRPANVQNIARTLLWILLLMSYFTLRLWTKQKLTKSPNMEAVDCGLGFLKSQVKVIEITTDSSSAVSKMICMLQLFLVISNLVWSQLISTLKLLPLWTYGIKSNY